MSSEASLVWRGDGAAERAGLENRRWGNSSASSNLAPSAIFQQVVNFHQNYLPAHLSQVSLNVYPFSPGCPG